MALGRFSWTIPVCLGYCRNIVLIPALIFFSKWIEKGLGAATWCNRTEFGLHRSKESFTSLNDRPSLTSPDNHWRMYRCNPHYKWISRKLYIFIYKYNQYDVKLSEISLKSCYGIAIVFDLRFFIGCSASDGSTHDVQNFLKSSFPIIMYIYGHLDSHYLYGCVPENRFLETGNVLSSGFITVNNFTHANAQYILYIYISVPLCIS